MSFASVRPARLLRCRIIAPHRVPSVPFRASPVLKFNTSLELQSRSITTTQARLTHTMSDSHIPKITNYPANNEQDPSGVVSNDTLVLYANPICPFVQRVRIALAEKKVDYVDVTVDLKTPRPDWYLKNVNYRGKVPAIRYKGKVLTESSPLVEYVDEVIPGAKLFPADAYKRSVARSWIQFCNDTLIPAYYGFLKEQDEKAREEKRAALDKVIFELEDALKQHQEGKGPFFFGDEFSAVDANFLPFFARLVVLEHYRDYSLPENATRVQRWYKEGIKRDSVQSTSMDKEEFITAYAGYAGVKQ